MKNFKFAGHETFACRFFWLKKAFDFIQVHGVGELKASPKAMLELGVGKNMVSSIAFWVKAFGMVDENDELNNFYTSIFESDGYDPFIEDEGTLWMLHAALCDTEYASIYKLIFDDYITQKGTNVISCDKFLRFLNFQYNDEDFSISKDSTLIADFKVFLSMYLNNSDIKTSISLEDAYSSIFADLRLINLVFEESSTERVYQINRGVRDDIPIQIMAYLLINKLKKSKKESMSFDDFYRNVGVRMCLTVEGAEYHLQRIQDRYGKYLIYKDNSGVKEVQLKGDAGQLEQKMLKEYYG